MSLNNDRIRINKTQGEVRHICYNCSGDRKKSKEKCLAINGETGAYLCHHCGDSGIINQYKTYEKQKDVEYSRPEMTNSTDLSDEMVNWFRSRGISQRVLLKNKITQKKEYMPQVSSNRNVICFNYFRDGELVNVKYRDGEKNFKQHKDAEKIFYGLDDIKDHKEVYIVEGEMDKLSLNEIGIDNCVSVPDGAPNPGTKNYDNKFSYLDNCWEYFQDMEKIYICSDNDANGRVLLEELSRRIGRERCFIVKFPDEIKDVNQMLVDQGVLALEKVLKDAEPYPVDGIFTVKSEQDYMIDVFNNGKKKGLTTGYQVLDNHYTLRTSELDVWTGIPGSGKTMMALQHFKDWRKTSLENIATGELYMSNQLGGLGGLWINPIHGFLYGI